MITIEQLQDTNEGVVENTNALLPEMTATAWTMTLERLL
jgi:hypothetical protein